MIFAIHFTFNPADVDQHQPGIWRYRHTFGIDIRIPTCFPRRGQHPIIGQKSPGVELRLSVKYQNPSGSFKDRGSAVHGYLASTSGHYVKRWRILQGTQELPFAAYAARVGIKARIYVPRIHDRTQTRQIEAYGAELVQVPGDRGKAAEAVKAAADRGSTYASHAYLAI